MQVLLANAKIMFSEVDQHPWSEPRFQTIANDLALEMASYDVDTLAKQLDCSRKLAAENWQRYQNFFIAKKMPAILSFNGQAYKHLKAKTLSQEALEFGQQHLWITCFLYGLLRPMDGIVPYRMEHCVKLETTPDKPVNRRTKQEQSGVCSDYAMQEGGRPEANRRTKHEQSGTCFDYALQEGRRPLVNQFWKDKLTDVLIDSVKADDGILIHLSTEEYEHLFDWNRVCREVKVIHPLFYVRQKDGSLKMQAVWAKSCRGAMVRFILQHQLLLPDELYAFSYEGFEYTPRLGEELYPFFVREI